MGLLLLSLPAAACSTDPTFGVYAMAPFAHNGEVGLPTNVTPWVWSTSPVDWTLRVAQTGEAVPFTARSDGGGLLDLVLAAPLQPDTTYTLEEVTEDTGDWGQAIDFTTALGPAEPAPPTAWVEDHDAWRNCHLWCGCSGAFYLEMELGGDAAAFDVELVGQEARTLVRTSEPVLRFGTLGQVYPLPFGRMDLVEVRVRGVDEVGGAGEWSEAERIRLPLGPSRVVGRGCSTSGAGVGWALALLAVGARRRCG